MHFAKSTALLAALVHTVYAQQDPAYIQGLVDALKSNNLTTFATIAVAINSTTAGQALLADLSQGNKTVFAPTNDACKFGFKLYFSSPNNKYAILFVVSAVPSQVTSNSSAVAAIISYHVLNGNFSSANANFPNVTIGRTYLNQTGYVNLEGNKSQVVAWSNINGKNIVLNQA
jgi:uncharacterized surface protein with fasciclin (FAS1) repeats